MNETAAADWLGDGCADMETACLEEAKRNDILSVEAGRLSLRLRRAARFALAPAVTESDCRIQGRPLCGRPASRHRQKSLRIRA
jgi:hypothetical protein